jgi:disulfide bond formation protein DsbB
LLLLHLHPAVIFAQVDHYASDYRALRLLWTWLRGPSGRFRYKSKHVSAHPALLLFKIWDGEYAHVSAWYGSPSPNLIASDLFRYEWLTGHSWLNNVCENTSTEAAEASSADSPSNDPPFSLTLGNKSLRVTQKRGDYLLPSKTYYVCLTLNPCHLCMLRRIFATVIARRALLR